jgi:transposase InsO family protein
MKTKDEVFSGFQAFVENQTGKKIKALRLDNEGEYTSKDFDSFCRDIGIRRAPTIPYISQENGVTERKNKSIIETTKAMIHDICSAIVRKI